MTSKSINAGDTFTISGSFPSYPVEDSWQLYYSLNGTVRLIATSSNGVQGEWLTQFSANQTRTLPTGSYMLSAMAVRNGERYPLEQSYVQVYPDPFTTTGNSLDHINLVLKMIDATLEGRVTNDVENFSIGGRSVAHIPIPELTALKASYLRQKHRLKFGTTNKFGSQITTVFTSF